MTVEFTHYNTLMHPDTYTLGDAQLNAASTSTHPLLQHAYHVQIFIHASISMYARRCEYAKY